MENSNLFFLFIFLIVKLSAQNNTFLIIDTLDFPENYSIDVGSDYLFALEYIDRDKFISKCDNFFGFKGEIINHDSRHMQGPDRHNIPNQFDICLEFISNKLVDTIAFPFDNNGGLLYLNNAWSYDTILIPRYSIIKNDIADSAFTIVNYDRIMRNGTTKFIKGNSFWSKPAQRNAVNTSDQHVLINGKQYVITPEVSIKEQKSTFNGNKYRRHTFFHKLLGIRQVRFGGVTIEYFKAINATIDLK